MAKTTKNLHLNRTSPFFFKRSNHGVVAGVLMLLFFSDVSAFQGQIRSVRPVETRVKSTMAAASSEISRSASRKKNSVTRLSYREDESEDVADKGSKWWKTDLNPTQAIVDDYLEFLDRRYHRLEDQGEEATNKPLEQPMFSAWKWFTKKGSVVDGSGAIAAVPPTSPTDDALYVLGVANLASQRLLQKHHLPVSVSKGEPLEAVIVSKQVDQTAVATTPLIIGKQSSTMKASDTAAIVAVFGAVYKHCARQRKRCNLFQDNTKTRAAESALRTVFKAAVRKNAVQRHPGQKKIAVAASSAVFVLLLRVAQEILAQATHA